ncbi:hypothetical protein LZ30DRAFT_713444 [Colletotrichum cereale]|nr:hypothetical protein LZ30DRAFT_713444 [Colletotrichum cereale]
MRRWLLARGAGSTAALGSSSVEWLRESGCGRRHRTSFPPSRGLDKIPFRLDLSDVGGVGPAKKVMCDWLRTGSCRGPECPPHESSGIAVSGVGCSLTNDSEHGNSAAGRHAFRVSGYLGLRGGQVTRLRNAVGGRGGAIPNGPLWNSPFPL